MYWHKNDINICILTGKLNASGKIPQIIAVSFILVGRACCISKPHWLLQHCIIDTCQGHVSFFTWTVVLPENEKSVLCACNCVGVWERERESGRKKRVRRLVLQVDCSHLTSILLMPLLVHCSVPWFISHYCHSWLNFVISDKVCNMQTVTCPHNYATYKCSPVLSCAQKTMYLTVFLAFVILSEW